MAHHQGGGVITVTEGIVGVIASIFMSSSAHAGNGGVLTTDSIGYCIINKVEKSYFFNNINTAITGGAIATTSNDTVIAIESVFKYNRAFTGGAIYANTGSNAILNCSNFSHNSAKTNGGAIYSNKQNRLSFNNYCEINYNRADNNGGVICLSLQSELNITGDSYFIRNHALSGGAIYANESRIEVHGIVNVY